MNFEDAEIADTPSHTVRELQEQLEEMQERRYTLTYSEGTLFEEIQENSTSIHPHIQ